MGLVPLGQDQAMKALKHGIIDIELQIEYAKMSLRAQLGHIRIFINQHYIWLKLQATNFGGLLYYYTAI